MNTKNNNIDKLIKILESTENFISGYNLSVLLNVTERTIRNYVNELTSEGLYQIESSQKGYKLKEKKLKEYNLIRNEVELRSNTLLHTLISASNKISVFHLAEQLNVSESTILNDINNKLKPLFQNFDLKIITHDFDIVVQGTEQNKRKLIGYIAINSSTEYFSSLEILENITPEIDIKKLEHKLNFFLDETQLSINQYAKNNLILHLIIMFIRLSEDNYLSDDNKNSKFILNNIKKDKILLLVNKISDFFYTEYSKKIPSKDINQIILIIAVSIDQFEDENITLENITYFVGSNFFQINLDLLRMLSKVYNIPKFDEYFIIQFVLSSP